MKNKFALVLIALAMTGCATKQYPQAPEVTNEESSAFDCKALDQEIAKTHSVQSQIAKTGEFNGRTVMGFIGDFGIGNGMAKSSATEKANARLAQLQNLKAARNCP